jgi:hypothetical protein
MDDILNLAIVKVEVSRGFQSIRKDGETVLFRPDAETRTTLTVKYGSYEGTLRVDSTDWNEFLRVAMRIEPEDEKTTVDKMRRFSDSPNS